MSLTPQEERSIRRIERELQVSDPDLDQRMRGTPQDSSWGEQVAAWCFLTLGVTLSLARGADGVIASLMAGPALVAAGWFFGRRSRGRPIWWCRLRAWYQRLRENPPSST